MDDGPPVECRTILEPDGAGPAPDDRLSVVILFGRPYDDVALDEAVFSVVAQDHTPLEVVVALPDCGADLRRRAEAVLRAQPWPAGSAARLVVVRGRADATLAAHLLNTGLRHATGRYLACLHHQDLVYQHGYAALIARLVESGAAIAMGGVRRAAHQRAPGHWRVASKEGPPDRAGRLALLAEGALALNGLVADRDRLEPADLHIDDPDDPHAVPLLLVRLATHPAADLALAARPVCERRRFLLPGVGELPPEGASLTGVAALAEALEQGELRPGTPAAGMQILVAEAMKSLSPR